MYIYILKKTEQKKKKKENKRKEDNKSQLKEVNLRKTLEQNCVFIQAKPHNYVLIY